MLSKLIKYDLKYIYKQLIVFYGIVITLAIIARLTGDIVYNTAKSPFLLSFIYQFAAGATMGFLLGMFINAVMRIWARFKSTIYGDESYLAHTLPVTRSQLWCSKFISTIITLLINFIILIIVLFFTSLPSKQFSIQHIIDTNSTLDLLIIFMAFFGQIVFIVMCGLTGIILGHRHNRNPMARAVLYGITMYFTVGLLMVLVCFIWGKLDYNVYQLFFEGHIYTANDVILLLGIIGGFYIIVNILVYIADDRLLNRGVNVD